MVASGLPLFRALDSAPVYKIKVGVISAHGELFSHKEEKECLSPVTIWITQKTSGQVNKSHSYEEFKKSHSHRVTPSGMTLCGNVGTAVPANWLGGRNQLSRTAND